MDISFLIDPLLKCKKEVLRIYNQDTLVHYKKDNSPVTNADLFINEILLEALHKHTPNIPVVSEESSPEAVFSESTFWLVDPLDGTKEFIKQNGEFTINVGLIKNGSPVEGIIYAPFFDDLYCTKNGNSFHNNKIIHTRAPSNDGLRVVVSRSHSKETILKQFLQNYTIQQTKFLGSSLKMCYISEGLFDLYPRLAPTMEWDTAAAHALLLQAGGSVLTLDHLPLTYGKKNYKNPHFVALSDNNILK